MAATTTTSASRGTCDAPATRNAASASFVVGTGGRSHYGCSTIGANSEAYGVLKRTMHVNGYDWHCVHEAGKTFTDSGSGSCH